MIQNLRPEHPDDASLLPARMINEYCYCPRLFYLEHVDGLFAHNADTIEGVARHARVDTTPAALPAGAATEGASPEAAKENADSDQEPEQEMIAFRSRKTAASLKRPRRFFLIAGGSRAKGPALRSCCVSAA